MADEDLLERRRPLADEPSIEAHLIIALHAHAETRDAAVDAQASGPDPRFNLAARAEPKLSERLLQSRARFLRRSSGRAR